MLHGIGSNAQSFEPLIHALDGRIHALAWDAPGYGDSRILAADWPTADDYASVLLQLLDQLDISQCLLVGHSLGTLIAARFAVCAPQRLTALALVSPTLGYRSPQGRALPGSVGKRIEDLDRLGPDGFAAARAAGLIADPPGRPDVVEAVRRAMAAVRRPGYDQAARMLASGDILASASKITIPTLVIVGDRDRVTPPDIARQVFDALPDSRGHHRYCIIPNAGHAVCQEQPADIANVLSNFLNGRMADKAPADA
jgi:pimeloyl-ACP methyl ester carboxylesterase